MNSPLVHFAPSAPPGPRFPERHLTPDAWRPGRDLPPLRAGEVHLWRASLKEGAELSRTGDLLSTPEWLSAGRLRCEHERKRHIAACALRRAILAPYVGEEPAVLRFESGQGGKSTLAGSLLQFHLCHGGDVLLLALAYGREVGVDVEEMHAHIPCEMLADHYLAPEAAWSLRLLPPAERTRRFYALWTAAEARRHTRAERCSLVSAEPVEGYAGALAVGGGEFRLECCSWQK
jgi:4'-phosphopantetheinyl transferase